MTQVDRGSSEDARTGARSGDGATPGGGQRRTRVSAWGRRARELAGVGRRGIRSGTRRLVADLRAAWALTYVRHGMWGMLLLGLGAMTPAFLPPDLWLLDSLGLQSLEDGGSRVLGTGLILGGVALVLHAWLRLRPTDRRDTAPASTWFLWSLPILLAPPLFSRDAYSYAAQGLIVDRGMDPYTTGPISVPGEFADNVDPVWLYTPAPYGPLALQISHSLVLLAGLNPYYSTVLMRLPALLGVALICHYLPRISRLMGLDARLAAWFACVNPLLVIDFVGGAHNDALMMGLVVWGLYLAYRGRFLVALLLVGVASAIKQPAMLAAYPIAIIGSGWTSWQWRPTVRFIGRALFACAVVIGTFAAISVATGLGFGWMNAVSVPGMVVTMAPFSLLGWAGQLVLDALGLDPTHRLAHNVSQTIGLVLSVVAVGWLAIRVAQKYPMRFLSWAWLAFAVFGPALHSWYLLWGGLLLPLTKPSARLRRIAGAVTTVLLVYGAGNLAWRNDAVALALAAIAAALVWWVWRTQQRRLQREGADADDE